MPQFTKNLQINTYGVQSPFVIATSKRNDPEEICKNRLGFYIVQQDLMCFFWGKTAVFNEVANGANFVVTIKRVIAALGNGKRHFLAREFHLQVVVFGFVTSATKTLEHVDNVAPMNVVRSWVREQLFQRLLSV